MLEETLLDYAAYERFAQKSRAKRRQSEPVMRPILGKSMGASQPIAVG